VVVTVENPAALTSTAITVLVNFSQPVIPGLRRLDLAVTNAHGGEIPTRVIIVRKSDTVYQQFFSLKTDGSYFFSLPAAVLQDEAGNTNLASNQVSGSQWRADWQGRGAAHAFCPASCAPYALPRHETAQGFGHEPPAHAG